MTRIPNATAELVITAPEPYAADLAYAARARTTLGVLTQLFAEAKQHVVITAPFVQAEAVLEIGVLADAIRSALIREVSVDIMTTRSNLDLPIVREMARKHRSHLRLFYPAFPSSELSRIGSHAKFCIRDAEAAYVGSANLTSPALGGSEQGYAGRQHFEMGLLVRGEIASQIHRFWLYSVRFGIFVKLDHSEMQVPASS